MTVIVNDSLLSYLLDVEAWTLRAEGARADGYIGDCDRDWREAAPVAGERRTAFRPLRGGRGR